MKTVTFKMFGKTRLIPHVTYTNRIKDDPPKDNWDKELWIERGEDWYGLESLDYRNVTVLVVERDEWLRGQLMNDEWLNGE